MNGWTRIVLALIVASCVDAVVAQVPPAEKAPLDSWLPAPDPFVHVVDDTGAPVRDVWVVVVDDVDRINRFEWPHSVDWDAGIARSTSLARRTVTGASGRFVPSPTHQLVLWHPRHVARVIPAGGLEPGDEIVMQRGATVELVVSQPRKLPPLGHLSARLLFQDGAPFVPMWQQQRFSVSEPSLFTGLVPGTWSLQLITAGRRVLWSVSFVVAGSEHHRIDVTALERPVVALRLEGESAAFQVLLLCPVDRPAGEFALCRRGRDGIWRAVCGWSGPTRLLGARVHGAGGPGRPGQMELLAQFDPRKRAGPVPVTLPRGRLEGVVSPAIRGRPLGLRLWDLDAGLVRAQIDIAPEQSAFQFLHVPAGSYRLHLFGQADDPTRSRLLAQARARVADGELVDVALVPLDEAQIILRVDVVDASGRPLPDSRVFVKLDALAPLAFGVTGETGRIDLRVPRGVEGATVFARNLELDLGGSVSVERFDTDGSLTVKLTP